MRLSNIAWLLRPSTFPDSIPPVIHSYKKVKYNIEISTGSSNYYKQVNLHFLLAFHLQIMQYVS